MNEALLIIIDDEAKVAEALKGMITKVLFPHTKMEVIICKSVKEGAETIKRYQPDMIFLDIKMPEQDGFELFKYIDTERMTVVFTTAYLEYALESINTYGCFGYLLKPINRDELSGVFKRFEEKSAQSKFLKIINDKGKRIFIDCNDILFCQAANNYCELYLKDKKYLVSKTLKNIVEKINHKNFVRVHRSYFVNLHHVESYSKDRKTLQLNSVSLPMYAFEKKVIPVGKNYVANVEFFFL